MSGFDLGVALFGVLGAGFLIWWGLYRLLAPRTPPPVTTLLGVGDVMEARKRSPHG